MFNFPYPRPDASSSGINLEDKSDMKINIDNRRRLIRMIIPAVYVVIISMVLVRAFRKPEYNWDMLAYIAVVISGNQQDIAGIHRETYQAARDQTPPAAFHQLVNPANPYRLNMFRNDTAFYRQLAFYVVKPLYTALVYLGYRAGFSLPASTMLPSVIAYFGIAILLFFWFSKYLDLLYAAAAALLIMLSAPLLTVSGLSTPDALSAFLLLAGFYFILQKPLLPVMLLFMTASVLARMDNIIVCVLTLFLLAVARKAPFKITKIGWFVIFLWLSAVYLFVAHRASTFGFGAFYYPSFLRYLNMPHRFQAHFSLRDYLQVFRADAITGFYHSAIALFAFLALLLFYKNGRAPLHGLSFYSLLPVLFCLIFLIRFMLDPDISDRFYIPYYLLIAVLWVQALTEKDSAVFQISKTGLIHGDPVH